MDLKSEGSWACSSPQAAAPAPSQGRLNDTDGYLCRAFFSVASMYSPSVSSRGDLPLQPKDAFPASSWHLLRGHRDCSAVLLFHVLGASPLHHQTLALLSWVPLSPCCCIWGTEKAAWPPPLSAVCLGFGPGQSTSFKDSLLTEIRVIGPGRCPRIR